MAFDGIVTEAAVKEIRDAVLLGKIDKINQPDKEDLVLTIHTKDGNRKLLASCSSASSSIILTEENFINPREPFPFCMLLRKHLRGARIVDVYQRGSERIVEIVFETLTELGFTARKRLIVEIMGKHSNVTLVDGETGKIIDSIKRITPDIDRVRQILPGLTYTYPPEQDKIPYKEATSEELENAGETGRELLSAIGGLSPAAARELARAKGSRKERLDAVRQSIEDLSFTARVYSDENGRPVDFHIMELEEYEESCEVTVFSSLSAAAGFFFSKRVSSNKTKQRAGELKRAVEAKLDKLYLKGKRLNEDLLKAQNSGYLRLYGELLTANVASLKQGMSHAEVLNYYNNEMVDIPMDPRLSPAKNAQRYFKRYGKEMTAIKEKTSLIEENNARIEYLESVTANIDTAENVTVIDDIRAELEETGYLRRRTKRSGQNNYRKKQGKKYKASPRKFLTSDGFSVLVGKNNRENDALTFGTAAKTDYWLHTKDIPGSHVILRTNGEEPSETALREAASIAAFYSKGRSSENVPVDYVKVRFVKKPNGALPGKVIFTNNRTLYVDPVDPEKKEKK